MLRTDGSTDSCGSVSCLASGPASDLRSAHPDQAECAEAAASVTTSYDLTVGSEAIPESSQSSSGNPEALSGATGSAPPRGESCAQRDQWPPTADRGLGLVHLTQAAPVPPAPEGGPGCRVRSSGGGPSLNGLSKSDLVASCFGSIGRTVRCCLGHAGWLTGLGYEPRSTDRVDSVASSRSGDEYPAVCRAWAKLSGEPNDGRSQC
jgi:hypothetical protein